MNYKCIFFDLDHTLWDYETNSCDTLRDLYDHFQLDKRGVQDFEAFFQFFRETNYRLWDLYDRELISVDVIRNERFKQVLEQFDAMEEQLAADLSLEYHHNCPARNSLMPHAIDTLHYLSTRYRLTVVTNGFEETQHVKLNASNITRFFDHVITSQKAGCKKPAREIFEFALKSNDIQPQEAIMVGDNLMTDMGGARNAAIDAAFFNPEKITHTEPVKYEITCLSELRNFL